MRANGRWSIERNDRIASAIHKHSDQITIDWSNGDLLIIDNWRMAHSRGARTGEDEWTLSRIFLESKVSWGKE